MTHCNGLRITKQLLLRDLSSHVNYRRHSHRLFMKKSLSGHLKRTLKALINRITSFFNEVLKMCKEADPTMSEATKLKNLLSKAIPSIQFQVRKKKPTTTREFLDYAKEAEELIHSSNLSNDVSNSQLNHTQSVNTYPLSRSSNLSPNYHPNNYYHYTSYSANRSAYNSTRPPLRSSGAKSCSFVR